MATVNLRCHVFRSLIGQAYHIVHTESKKRNTCLTTHKLDGILLRYNALWDHPKRHGLASNGSDFLSARAGQSLLSMSKMNNIVVAIKKAMK